MAHNGPVIYQTQWHVGYVTQRADTNMVMVSSQEVFQSQEIRLSLQQSDFKINAVHCLCIFSSLRAYCG